MGFFIYRFVLALGLVMIVGDGVRHLLWNVPIPSFTLGAAFTISALSLMRQFFISLQIEYLIKQMEQNND
jgi:hypothetical protein